MMYCSWDKKHKGWNVLSFWTILCPFTPPPRPSNNPKKSRFWKKKKKRPPLTTQKNQDFEKKRKNAWRYHFTKMHQKSWLYVLNCSSMYDKCNFYFLFWAIFHLQLNILDVCYTNNHHMMYHSWDMVRKQKRDRQMDRWTDRHMEKVTYRGGCPSKNGWICSR